jgi:hypothetical protein
MSLNDSQIETVKNVLGSVGEKCDVLIEQLDEFELEAALTTLCEIEFYLGELQ